MKKQIIISIEGTDERVILRRKDYDTEVYDTMTEVIPSHHYYNAKKRAYRMTSEDLQGWVKFLQEEPARIAAGRERIKKELYNMTESDIARVCEW